MREDQLAVDHDILLRIVRTQADDDETRLGLVAGGLVVALVPDAAAFKQERVQRR